MKTSHKLGLLGSLYIAQGLPFGFFSQAMPVLLRKQGLSLPEIGLAQALALPWALKFLLAPWMDRRASSRLGARRGFILPLQILGGLTLGLLALASPAHGMAALVLGMFLTNAFAATQDIATDALAVDLLNDKERGLGNGIQVAGYRVGMILGGGLMLIVFDHFGWPITFLGLALMTLLMTIPIGLHREKAIERVAPPRMDLAAWKSWFARPGLAAWLLLLVLYKTGEWFATGMLRPFLADKGLTLTQIGTLLGGVGFTAGLFGALIGGALTNRLGRKRALLLFGLLQAIAVGLYGVAAMGVPLSALYAICAFEHLASGMATAALFTAMMDCCRPDHAATDYTVQSCVVVITSGTAAGLSGLSAAHLGYPIHFAVAMGLCLLGVVCVALYREGNASFRLLTPKGRGRTAVYAGSFDPVTKGHLSVIEESARLFDRVVVLLAKNPGKSPLFSFDERLQMLRDAVSVWPNVAVEATDGLVVEHARSVGAEVLIRGVRDADDWVAETQLAELNRGLAPEIATLLLPANPQLRTVSSSALKEHALRGEDVSGYCPPSVAMEIGRRLGLRGRARA